MASEDQDMKELITALAKLFFNPSTILTAAIVGAWRLIVTALYLMLVSVTVSALRAATGYIHWLLWALVFIDEAVFGILLAEHLYHVIRDSPFSQWFCIAWGIFKRLIKNLSNE